MSRLEGLPEELLTLIATYADASSILKLSATSRKLRSCSYSALIFQRILTDSQEHRWGATCLDLASIERTAGKDASIWARFALADDKAWRLAEEEQPFSVPSSFPSWLADISAAKHPFLLHPCWRRFFHDPGQHLAEQIFALGVAILASTEEMRQSTKRLRTDCSYTFHKEGDRKAILWTLCSIAVTIRTSLRLRLAAWPYNSSQHVPYITPPTFSQLPLGSLNPKRDLPIPFSHSRGWRYWYDHHSSDMLFYAPKREDPAAFFDGRWCGYYTYHNQPHRLDPPMVNIQFRGITSDGSVRLQNNLPRPHGGKFDVQAVGCRDGVGPFLIHGKVTHFDELDNVSFVGTKTYSLSTTAWSWDCRLTPFGMVGSWGHSLEAPGGMERLGDIWLWKESWTRQA